MPNLRQIKLEQADLRDLKLVIDSYQEIAAGRMRRVKKSVLQNREFMAGLSDLYQRVLVTYKLDVTDDKKRHTFRKSKNTKSSLIQTNGKTVSVLISANTGLYGGLVKHVFDFFFKSVSTNKHDLVVIGRVGKVLCDTLLKGREYKFFEADDTGAKTEMVSQIASYLLNYENVIIYHGLYVSILEQKSVSTYVTGEALKIGENKDAIELKCLIEPSIEEVLGFFEQQISSAIFEQTIFESSLSKFASRMVSLDVASDNINKLIEKVKFTGLKAKHQQDGFSQMESLSGITLWTL